VWVFIRNRPEYVGLQPYGGTPAPVPGAAAEQSLTFWAALRQALQRPHTWNFIYLGFA
jgi:hypothetical protein